MDNLPIFEESKTLRFECHKDTIEDIPVQWRDKLLFFGRLRRISLEDEDFDVRIIQEKATKLWGCLMTDARHCGKVLIDLEYETDLGAERALDEFAEALKRTREFSI
ncbi:MAG: hypothetical protein MJ152_01320 [Clostridia bacterium]|nr:hypothetical protein [Clostridia bacterium]